MSDLVIRPAGEARWDCVALGEVMLRLGSGDEGISRTRSFRVLESGGEYSVARGLRTPFGLRATIVTALVDNPVGRLVDDLILQGGVDRSHVIWRPFDGVGRLSRNGLDFAERGYGVGAALGCPDRGHTAASQLRRGEVDWGAMFGGEGARWFHTGGIFAGLSESTPEVALEAMTAARRHGVVVSYDLSYRPALWQEAGGKAAAQDVNRELVTQVDVLLGNAEDFAASLGFEVEGVDESPSALDTASYGRMVERLVRDYPNVKVVATTLRTVRSASGNDWAALLWADGRLCEAKTRVGLEVYDRVGGGDSFVSGLAYAFLAGMGPLEAVEYGTAHGALAMTTPGDTSMVTIEDVERLVRGGTARVVR